MGRRYVAAYVEYVHYTERLYDAAARSGGHEDHSAQKLEAAPPHDH